MIKSTLLLAWQAYKQQRSNHEQRLMSLTQGVLIFCLALLSFVMMSMQSHLQQNLAAMLGADLVVSQQAPFNEIETQYLAANSQQISFTQLLDITLSNNGNWQAIQLKVVDENYPIQGQLMTSLGFGQPNIPNNTGPQSGHIWLDSRAASSLGLTVGDKVIFGSQKLHFSALLKHEPDRLLEGHSVAMRGMINLGSWQQLALSDLNITYRYLLNAGPKSRQKISNWLTENAPAVTILSAQKGHPLASFWQRTESVLGMSMIVLFLMGAIAIDLAARKQIVGQTRYIAVCLSSGMSRNQGLLLAIVQWFYGFIVVLLPSLLLAYICQYLVLQHLFSHYGDIAPSIAPLQLAKLLVMLLLILSIFQIPMWQRLAGVSVANLVHQRGTGDSVLIRVLWTVPALGAFVLFYADNLRLAGMMLTALLATISLVIAMTWSLLSFGHRVTVGRSGLLPFCLYMMKSRLVSKATQILGIGLCAMLLLFTLMLMRDIGNSMERYTREQDGNFVISQISQSSIATLQQWSSEADAEIRQMRPFTYAKLHRVEQQLLDDWQPTPSESKTTLKKEIRLHWSNEIPANNRVVEGDWWDDSQRSLPVISIEEEVMTDIGLQIGQTVTLLIAGRSVDFVITASHQFQSGAGSITFWLQVPEDFLRTLEPPVFYMGSVEVSDDKWHLVAQLYRNIPIMRAVSLEQLTQSFDRTLKLVSQFTIGFSGMILLLALLVIVGAVKGFELDEQRKNGLMMSFGVSQTQCVRLYLYEWVITAIIAVIGAAAGTWIAGQLIYQSQFSLNYEPDLLWMASVLTILMLTVCTVGMRSCKQGLQVSIKDLLNQ